MDTTTTGKEFDFPLHSNSEMGSPVLRFVNTRKFPEMQEEIESDGVWGAWPDSETGEILIVISGGDEPRRTGVTA